MSSGGEAMSKQSPMLMEGPITKSVFIVTRYKDLGDGTFQAYNKFDVTEQFDMLAEQRSGKYESLAKRVNLLEKLLDEWHSFAIGNGLDQSCADYEEWCALEQVTLAELGR
jgi:hypothetical protein